MRIRIRIHALLNYGQPSYSIRNHLKGQSSEILIPFLDYQYMSKNGTKFSLDCPFKVNRFFLKQQNVKILFYIYI